MTDNRRHYQRSHDWIQTMLMMQDLGLNSPDDLMQLLSALTSTGEVFDHPELACIWRFALHFGFMDPEGNIRDNWARHWRAGGSEAWRDGGRDEWLAWSDPLYPSDIGPRLRARAQDTEEARESPNGNDPEHPEPH